MSTVTKGEAPPSTGTKDPPAGAHAGAAAARSSSVISTAAAVAAADLLRAALEAAVVPPLEAQDRRVEQRLAAHEEKVKEIAEVSGREFATWDRAVGKAARSGCSRYE